jgi:hypothetical protein
MHPIKIEQNHPGKTRDICTTFAPCNLQEKHTSPAIKMETIVYLYLAICWYHNAYHVAPLDLKFIEMSYYC